MNIKLFPECRLSVTVKELVTKFSFGNEAEDCMVGKCDVFSTSQTSIDNCNAESASENDTSSPSNVSDIEDENENLGEHSIVYYESACGQDNKLTKILSKKSINESIDLFKRTIGALKKHIYVKRVQFEFYDEVKNNLSRNETLVHVNYSENYENKHQREIQSAYFGYTTFSIFNVCCTFVMLPEKSFVSRLPYLVSYKTTQDQLQLRVFLSLLIIYRKSTNIFR